MFFILNNKHYNRTQMAATAYVYHKIANIIKTGYELYYKEPIDIHMHKATVMNTKYNYFYKLPYNEEFCNFAISQFRNFAISVCVKVSAHAVLIIAIMIMIMIMTYLISVQTTILCVVKRKIYTV